VTGCPEQVHGLALLLQTNFSVAVMAKQLVSERQQAMSLTATQWLGTSPRKGRFGTQVPFS